MSRYASRVCEKKKFHINASNEQPKNCVVFVGRAHPGGFNLEADSRDEKRRKRDGHRLEITALIFWMGGETTTNSA